MQQDLRMAVLIDADNVPRNCISDIMQELAVYGTPTIKRIYGDWTNVAMSSWKAELLKNAFTPMQQYGYTTGKNSTDSAMIIDAMDILYAGAVEAFCIVSSDSDFTRLALRLREAGKKVYGVGENKTPEPFRVACDKFIYVEVLNAQRDEQTRKPRQKPAAPPAQQPPQPPAAAPPPLPSQILVLISNTIEDVCDDDGWAYLGEVGSLLQKKKPDFDPRSYGYKKLTLLVGANDNFEMDARENTQRSSGKQIYVRNRR